MRTRATASRCIAALVGAALAVLMGCSSGSRPAPGSSKYYEGAAIHKQEILVLWKQIREWRVEELGLPPNPHRAELAFMFHSSIHRLRICPKQPKPKTPKCTDVCTIKDAICDNAADICRIAAKLPSDKWARDKCNSAKASCKEAKGRCCGCIGREPKAAAGDSDVPQLPSPF